MRTWSAHQIAAAASARVFEGGGILHGPLTAIIDSRQAGPDALFVGLPGQHVDGGHFATHALRAGAWGVLASPAQADEARNLGRGVVLAADDPLRALQRLATSWRHHLAADVIGVTGSTGKTTTKDILRGILTPHRNVVASRANFNTEIGLPLEICNAPEGTDVLVLEMAMRGPHQIAELAEIAEPDVGMIVSIGPVHLELLGSIEAIATAKAELIAGLKPGSTAIVPAGERLLDQYRRAEIATVTFGDGGDVALMRAERVENDLTRLVMDAQGDEIVLEVPFTQAHLHRNTLAAVAAAQVLGVSPTGRIETVLSQGRGQRTHLREGILLIDDSYNANPMSMRAALEDLAISAARRRDGRAVAVLGDMLELGPRERDFHVGVGEYADAAGVALLVTVGPLASAMADGYRGETHACADAAEAAAIVPELLRPYDTVLVKASRGVGLDLVTAALGSEVSA